MNEIIQLQLWQLAAAYLFVVLLILLVKARGIPREKEIFLASVRMTLQLIVTGYVLVLIFDNPHPAITLFTLMVMQAFAVFNIYQRIKSPLTPALKRIIALAMILGTGASLFFFILVVIRLVPWYHPQYFIPLGGMIIGNSMTGIALGAGKLIDGVHQQRQLVEGALMLGATPAAAVRPLANSAFDAAILPTINSMLGMGIVFLPGMMTGQILSGVSPVTAIEYQIAIMLGITGSVTLTVFLMVFYGSRSFFNQQQQLELPAEPPRS
ncbi:ABC transporter permease [Anoxynatronum buryatiense]|uniref:ABC transport system permease protein n=1 Tax=Anoxynatronum buryatiense TaxID=489973 RepID=A0AA45WXB4_9CLOT|nr:iron export ABC transporter permease subunit FetB [Anoxynatronum buryatiense]SMP62762.1 putative ABC transport system permease protein [Anoxynatronum buryatiense]